MSVNPLSGVPHPRPLATAFTGLLALIAIAVALVAPASALAHTHHGACPASSAKRLKRTSHSCRASHRARTRTRHAGRPELPGTAVAKRGGAGGTRESAGADAPETSPASSEQLAASCEDGSEPALVAEETFACDDGSEPTCADGSELTLSPDGSKLLCSGSETDPSPGEPGCSEGSGAECDGQPDCEAAPASSSCEDGGEPGGGSATPAGQPSPARSQRSSGS